VNIVNMPVHDHPGSTLCAFCTGHVFAVDDAEFVLEVAQPKLGVARAFKIWLGF
jgi:hypothetical protein